MGKSIEDISVIINTHSHVEHIGANHEIKARSGAKLLVPIREADIIENYGVMAKRSMEDRLIPEVKKFFGDKTPPPPFEKQFYLSNYVSMKPVTVDQRLEDGAWIDLGMERLRVIHTPGHSPGHISLYEPDSRILFSGDQVVGSGVGVTYVGTELTEPVGDGNLSEYIASLREVLEMDIKTIIPCHGPTISDPKQIIQHSIDWYLKMERKVLDILSDGKKTPEDITKMLYPGREGGWIFYLKGQTIGILEKLKKEKIILQNQEFYYI